MDTQPPAMPGSSPQGAKRLVRRSDDKVIGGVAFGLAEYFGVDPVWIRLGFVVTAFLGGTGLLAYLVLWALLPTSEGTAPGASSLQRSVERLSRSIGATPAWVGAALVTLGVLLVFVQILEWDAGVFWGIALIVGGVLLFRQPDWSPAAAAPEASPAPPASPVPPVPSGDASAEPVSPLLPAPPMYRRVRERHRSRLGWITMGVVLVALGVAALLDLGDTLDVSAGQYPALALAVIGCGLIAGAFIGRARWLVVPGLLVIPLVLVASLIHVPFTGGFGDRSFNPTAIEAVEPAYHLVAGQMVLDLRGVPAGERPLSIRVTAVAGRVVVLASRATALDVRARVGAGEINLFGQRFDGVRVDVRRTFTPDPELVTVGSIRLDVETSLGVVEVRHGEATSS